LCGLKETRALAATYLEDLGWFARTAPACEAADIGEHDRSFREQISNTVMRMLYITPQRRKRERR
jgi:hypothetical protein